MTLFFLVVGLEAKRELDLGELRERPRLAIPVVAALGGMACAVAIYLAINAGGAARTAGARRCRPTPRSRSARSRSRRRAARRACGSSCSRSRSSTTSWRSWSSPIAYTEHVDVVALAIAIALFGVLLALRFAGRLARARRGADRRRRSGSRCSSPASTR